MVRLPAIAVVTLGLAACSTGGSGDRAARATDTVAHGWIDFTVDDNNVSADPIAELAGHPAKPPRCELIIDLDGRTVLSEVLWPNGASPPFSIVSTFRFAAPPGDHGATIHYTGCRAAAGQRDSITAEIRIPVRRSQVTRVRFDGSVFQAEFPASSSAE
ncbi:MAG: hypothetical protein ACE5FL_01110 [Myxococcota bacterium]